AVRRNPAASYEGETLVRQITCCWYVKTACTSAVLTLFVATSGAQTDPGVRGGAAGAGTPFSTLTQSESKDFSRGADAFAEVDSVQGPAFVPNTEAGLGPRFNLNTCQGCHIHPAAGGSSPAVNPQVAIATQLGATNVLPSFITLNGPV